ASKTVQEKMLKQFAKADPDYGRMVKEKLQ
ncbi:MAG: catalase-related domain-containing protein, partial [Bacteroidota bacterium]